MDMDLQECEVDGLEIIALGLFWLAHSIPPQERDSHQER